MNHIRVISARTKYSNSPETDLQPYVMHIVEAEVKGQLIQTELMATDPLDAMDKARTYNNWKPVEEKA
jgi:hypothetical protein